MNLEKNKRWFSIIGILCVAISAFYLYLGSIPMPWEYQTFSGNSVNEIQYRNEHNNQASKGLILLLVGSIIQLISIIKKEDFDDFKKLFKRR